MILVTGANGTVGSEITRQLVAAGRSVRAFVRDSEKASALPNAVDVAVGDFADPATLDSAMVGIERVFLASFDGPHQKELQGNLIDAAKRGQVRHIVRLSAADVSVHSKLMVCRWHWIAERQLEASGIGFTHLRPNWFMQNFQLFVVADAIALPAGNSRVSFIDVRDIAAVAVKAFIEPGHEGRAYTLNGPEALTHAEVADQLSAATGRTIVYADISPEEYRKKLVSEGDPKWSIDMTMELFADIRADMAAEITDTVARVTGRAPYAFSQYARDYVSLLTQTNDP